MRAPAGVQLRHSTTLTSEQYVTQHAWRQASLNRCPRHADGGCGFARHGTYARVSPPGMRVARWYCRDAGITFSALPDCLAARVMGSLDELETVLIVAESLGVEAAAHRLRPEVELPGVMRWLRRRRTRVRAALLALITLLPGRLGTLPELRSVRSVLGSERALVALREIGAAHLARLPYPLGFWPGALARAESERAFQHETGPDPPIE